MTDTILNNYLIPDLANLVIQYIPPTEWPILDTSLFYDAIKQTTIYKMMQRANYHKSYNTMAFLIEKMNAMCGGVMIRLCDNESVNAMNCLMNIGGCGNDISMSGRSYDDVNIQTACSANNVEAVELLVKKGLNKSSLRKGLYIARNNGNREIIK